MSEDLRPSGDITTKLIKNNKKIKAKIISNQNCVIGGLSFAKEAFKYSDKNVIFKTKTEDGKKIPMDVKVGDKVLFGKWSGTEVKIDGKEYSIMKESDIMGISKRKK